MNKFDFKGRNAVVTGAARGLGLAITERLLDGGAAVSMWDMDRGALETEAMRLRAKGKVNTAVVDVVNESQLETTALKR
jgi:NAD(P)-dependent dehydrogenase (short-subunit alcohol dehydrogenase family)